MNSKKTSVYLWPIITFIGLLLYKNYLINEYRLEFFLNIAKDCLLVALIIFLSIERQRKSLQLLQSLIASLIIFYNLADTCVYMAIQSRLTLNNFLGNINYYNVFMYFISVKMVVLILAVIIVPVLLRKRKIYLPYPPPTSNLLFCEILLALTIIFVIVDNNSRPYSGGKAIDLSTNSYTATSVTQETLTMMKNDFAALIQRIQDYFNGKNWNDIPKSMEQKPNIIIVISESLSMVDSKYAGGLFDRLPKIDLLQQDGVVFTHAVSNGKITPHGLAASLLGVQTIKTGGYAGMMEQFPPDKFPGNNIIHYAKDAGYTTTMISPGQPYSFYQMGDWFNHIGFDQVYGIDSQLFVNSPRFTWDAPSDEAMYDAALNMIPALKTPYFLVIETVSLHQSYILPDPKYRIGDNDLLNQINYVDGTTYDFYEKLKQQGTLANGYFIIYGDHRRFEPLEKEEMDDGGYSVWHERIVCGIVGKGIAPHTIYNAPFSLVDMNSLLHYIISGQPVNDDTILKASLSNQLGIEFPFNISLVDDDHGTYLIRSEKYAPLFLSIYGQVPFDDIPNAVYKDASVYLIENDQQVNRKVPPPHLLGGGGF